MYYPPQYYPYRQTSFRSIIIITVIVIVVIVGTYIYLRKKANDDSKDELPSDYADEVFTEEEGKTIRYYSLQIIDDLKGVNLYHDVDLYKSLMAQSDRLFSGIAIDFKRLQGKSLRQQLNDETSFAFQITPSKLRDAMIQRLNTLSIF